MAQQALRRQDDERQRVGQQQRRLTPQQVEVLRRRGAVGHPHVDVGTELKKPLGARARMVRPLALVRVRQQQDQRRALPPFHPRRGDELVENHLRAVEEIAVLRLPHHQARRLLHVVSVLESDHGVLGQRAVVDLEGRTRLRQRLQRHVDGAGLDVVKHGVPLAERAALDVLAGHPDADPVGQNRREGELLGGAPVDGAFIRLRQDLRRASPALAPASDGSQRPTGRRGETR